ncbi:MAG: class I SAM-dependent methyltransferase [Candidatus Aenigmarchaeota archaeon]|nr:class I SAM-dependent methyltransferase [Candidatus Aenigmarchaeota archaeon]
MGKGVDASFWDKVGSEIGYDFTSLRLYREGENCEEKFRRLVTNNICQNSVAIDIGVADGSFDISLSDKLKFIVGIDTSTKMIEKARQKLAISGSRNVFLSISDGRELPFADAQFDISISRRGPSTSSMEFLLETKRILNRGGIFLEITIGEKDKENIKRIFGRGQNYTALMAGRSEMLRKKAMLQKAGFVDIEVSEMNSAEFYESVEDIMFLLRNTPIIPDFNRINDMEYIHKLMKDAKTERGIRTNSHRIIISARK